MNILLIMPKFYAYQKTIREELERRGDTVTIYEEEPPKTRFLVLKNIESLFHMKNIYKHFNKQLVKKIVKEMPDGGYDYFLCIRGNVFTQEVIREIREKACKKGAVSTYYSWDAFRNLRHKGDIGYAFDRRLTFDSVDAQELDGYELLPLFYSDVFDGGEAEYEYDYCSISAWYPFRYKYLKAFMEKNPDKKCYFRLVLDPTVLKAKKVKEPELYNNLDMSIISMEQFSPEEIRDVCLKSKCIVDLATENQPGLTMRTMETLGIKRKLITNNKYLAQYEFYNKNNNIIYSDLPTRKTEDFILPDNEWLDAPYEENEEIRSKYSIHNWMTQLMGQ